MTTTRPTPTPGFNQRIGIWFQTNRNGRRAAYYWSSRAFRSFPIGLARAELLVATGDADQFPGHPFPKESM